MAKTKSDPAAAARQKHRDYLLPAVANYYSEPLVLESGDGLRVRDVDGRSYLDFFGGILTISIGHCDPRVNGPLKAQIDRLGHVSSLYQTLPTVELAERLARITPGRLKKSIFTVSGSEADDAAVVLAQVHTGAQEVIALRHGYSGRTILSQALTGHAPWRAVPTQIAAVKHAVSPYCYRCPFGLTYPGCEVKCARDIEELIQTTTTGRIAGFLAEPIQGVGGFITPPPEYFPIAVGIVRRYGGLFICDEVQTGFGRTGRKMFGIEHWGVEPEIMTMAKGIANGLPLAATITTDEIADSFKKMTISTFGGNPVSCAAANATLETIEKEDLPGNAERAGRRLRERLDDLKRRFPGPVGEVRGMGLMQAIELVIDEEKGDRTPDPKGTVRLFEETRKRGLLIGKGGLYGNVIRISPPLTVGEGEVDEAVAILREALREADRCLYCYDAPCISACPTLIDVPTFIRKIATGNLRGSARTILAANLLGATCARVCPVEVLCEGACVYVVWGRRPIEIGRLQRYAMERGASPDLLARAPRTGRSIGLIGAGPASLACAGTLALRGHRAILYEKNDLPGGLNTTGIAPYKLQLPDALAEVDFIRGLGVEVRTGVEVGPDLTAAELLDRHDALFLGPGLGGDMPLGIPGEDGPGVVGAVDWIRRLKTDPGLSIGPVRAAIVVGGGNTAVDVARELVGLGVEEVSIVYRRSEAEMKAYRHELARARQEGAVLIERAALSEILRDGGKVRAVRTVVTENGRPTGRVRGELPAQLVVLAIGQSGPRRLAAVFPGVTCDRRGCIEVDPESGATGNPRIFAGGDGVNGGKEVVNAVHEGQVAARAIDLRLRTRQSSGTGDGGGIDG